MVHNRLPLFCPPLPGHDALKMAPVNRVAVPGFQLQQGESRGVPEGQFARCHVDLRGEVVFERRLYGNAMMIGKEISYEISGLIRSQLNLHLDTDVRLLHR